MAMFTPFPLKNPFMPSLLKIYPKESIIDFVWNKWLVCCKTLTLSSGHVNVREMIPEVDAVIRCVRLVFLLYGV